MAFLLTDHDDHSAVKPPQQDSSSRQNHRSHSAQKPNADFRDVVNLLGATPGRVGAGILVGHRTFDSAQSGADPAAKEPAARLISL
jgi:hypothetical protein